MDPALPSFMQGMAQPGGSIHPAQWEQQAYCYSQPAGACGAIPPLCGGAGTYPSQAWMPAAAPQPPPAPAPPPTPTPGAGAAPPHAAGSAPANVTVDELRTLLNCASVSGATSASRKAFKALSAAEVNELKTKLVKTDIVPFINRLWRKAYRRGEIFRRLHGFWASGTRSQLVADIAAGDSALLEADTWLADAIGSCLDRSAAAVELFLRRPESNDLYAEAQGVTTLLRIAALARHEPGAAMTQAEQAFDDSKPLFMGMGNDEALLAVTQIASEFGMLSDRCRNTLDVYRAIADKLPAELSGKREAIEDKINEWRYTNWSPWRSFDAYSGYIASLVSSGRAETNAADANAAAAARAAAAAAAADAARAAEAAAAAARARDERAPPRETKCNKCAAALQAGKIDRRLAEKVCPGGLRRGTCVVCRVGPVPAKVDGLGDKPLGWSARKILVIANRQYNGEEEIGKGEANAAEAPAPDLRAAVPDDAVFGDAGCIGALETASAEATPTGDSAANAHDDGLEAYTSQLAALRGDIAHTNAEATELVEADEEAWHSSSASLTTEL